MNEIKIIAIEKIRPLEGQPRKYFDAEALKELAESIKVHGQITPVWVYPLGDDVYQLIAGERRWRACRLVNITTLVCEIRTELDTVDQRYIASVMENFGRQNCTTMETVRSIEQILKLYNGDFKKTAATFAKTEAWIRQLHSLLHLDPKVASLLEPPNAKISIQIAISLSNLNLDVQRKLATDILQIGLSGRAATRYISNFVTNDMRVSKKGARSFGRPRKPSDDFELLQRFLTAIGPQSQELFNLGNDRLQKSFAGKVSAIPNVCSVIRRRIMQLRELEKSLQDVYTNDANAGRSVSKTSKESLLDLSANAT